MEVTTEDVETFYADNQDQFMTIEQVRGVLDRNSMPRICAKG